jgi:hypothetical protein
MCYLAKDIFSQARRVLVGGSPTASYLFCFAKKGNPKKATLYAALRVPNYAKQKMGSCGNSLRSNSRNSFFHFLPRTIGSAEAEKTMPRRPVEMQNCNRNLTNQ